MCWICDHPGSTVTDYLDEVRATKHPLVRFGFEAHDEPQGTGGRQIEAQTGV